MGGSVGVRVSVGRGRRVAVATGEGATVETPKVAVGIKDDGAVERHPANQTNPNIQSVRRTKIARGDITNLFTR